MKNFAPRVSAGRGRRARKWSLRSGVASSLHFAGHRQPALSTWRESAAGAVKTPPTRCSSI
jgi:biotin-(acetyl-CoA carboxylase) ligase